MFRTRRPRPAWTLGTGQLLLLIAVTAGGAPWSAPLEASAGSWDAMPLERPDDPPGLPARARAAGTVASTITFGRFTSVQVNVTAEGADILGDAANEPSIAVDPTNHDRMVIGWRQFDTIASNFRQAGVGVSSDGGATWLAGKIEPGVFRSDPVLGVNAAGEFFYNSLRGNLTTQVFPSLNAGATWGAAVFAWGGDKQWMTVDRTGGESDGFIHQAWSQFATPTPETFNRSLDGGESFTVPSSLGAASLGGTLDVASDGTLYVVGTDGAFTVVARSLDARNDDTPATFTHSVVDLGGILLPPDTNTPNPVGLTGQLWIGVDRSNGPRAGWVYVLASVPTATDPMDVMFAHSTDGGQTWSAPRRVNDDPAGNGAWQWFGTMSVAPDGRIEAVWNDSRTTGDSTMTALWYSYSTDGGETWSANEQASPVWNSLVGWPNQAKIGDYYHMVSDHEGADLAWSATFNGGQDVYYMRIPRNDPLAVAEPIRGFALHPATPNPFRAATSLRFDVPPSGGHAKLEVFDVGGRRVATLVDRRLPGGAHVARWDGAAEATRGGVAPGVYLCRLEVGGATRTLRLLRVQ
jgi:hypothetical protein